MSFLKNCHQLFIFLLHLHVAAFLKNLTLKCIVSGFRIKLVSYSDFQIYFFKVLRNFDGMISQTVTDNLEHGGVEVCRRTQVKMGLTWGLGGIKRGMLET